MKKSVKDLETYGTQLHYLQWKVLLFLEDVAEKPERLERAQQLAKDAFKDFVEKT